MTTAQRQLYTGWGASIAFHVVVLLILAATGLFATFSQSEEKPPVDITVYDASGAAAPAAGGDSAPAPSAPAPSVDIAIPTDKEVPPDDDKKQEEEQKQDQTPSSNQDSHPTATLMKKVPLKVRVMVTAKVIRKRGVPAAVVTAPLRVTVTP